MDGLIFAWVAALVFLSTKDMDCALTCVLDLRLFKARFCDFVTKDLSNSKNVREGIDNALQWHDTCRVLSDLHHAFGFLLDRQF
jgi:hypothetical protein